jgi:hypothetical protein
MLGGKGGLVWFFDMWAAALFQTSIKVQTLPSDERTAKSVLFWFKEKT